MKVFSGVFLFVLLVALFQPLSAGQYNHNLLLGFKGGFTVSDMVFDDDDLEALFDSKTAMSGGLFINHFATERLKLQVELNYVRRGVSYELTYLDDVGNELGKGTTEYLFDYIEAPVLVAIIPFDNLQVRPKLIFGTQIGINVRTELRQPSLSKVGPSIDLSEAEDMSYGLIFGAGLEIDRGSSLLILEFQYLYGLSDIGLFGNSNYRSYSVQAGIAFGL